jgi:1-deoxy-D-xylulose-5-phosphate synthase
MSGPARYQLLSSIDSPADLRRLPLAKLPLLAHELRDHLVGSVSSCGGHFAAGLGAIELTIALHYVFNTPEDRLVWDVGHQCYPHKIVTGRRDRIGSIRRRKGLAPFLRRQESHYDAFGAGHSSTSISAALGMAIAARRQGRARKAVAVIGDGGMTAGLAYEALNHAGSLDVDLLVVLNDNSMSISPNVGALSNYLARLLSGKVLNHFPPMWDLARRAEKHAKAMLTPGVLFQELGFNYVGPIDGHDLSTLVKVLRNLRSLKGPRLLHVVTRKGKGYDPAEADPVKYHGVTPFDPKVGILATQAQARPTFTHVFGDWLCDMARQDERLVGITPAMREGSGLVKFSERYPERYFDVGIAEQHAVTLAAGLACESLKPVVAIYSTFLQRAYDQLIHDVAVQSLPVLFAIDRAGLVGPDGPTHNGSYDLSYLRCVPNLVVMTPADENECRQMLTTGYRLDQPAAVRYPRAGVVGVPIDPDLVALPLGKAQLRRRGRKIALLAFGTMLAPALEVGEEFDATVVNMRFVKPLDVAMVLELASTHELLVTLEEHAVQGGAGSAVNECLAAHAMAVSIVNLGLPDRFVEHATRDEMLRDAALDREGIAAALKRYYIPHVSYVAA